MTKTRVMVVDDSALVRAQLANWLAAEDDLEVAATAANGKQALDKLASAKPDLVVLDIEMPVMDGLATLREIRQRDREVPVIMFSTLASRGATQTLDALSMGATDYLLKPSSLAEVGASPAEVREQLLEKIRALRTSRVAPKTARPKLADPGRRGRVDVVAIGCSTGGPNALEALFSTLPADLPVPILIVQHMPPFFTGILAQRLSRVSPFQVQEAVPGASPRAGEAWIAPGGFHMTVERRGTQVVLATNEEPPENACRPAVDVLFRSVADVYGAHALGVMLTGMGQDGLRGCERLHAAGARIVAQDEASAVVWSMPGHVARAGLASALMAPADLGSEIGRACREGRGIREAPYTSDQAR